MSTDARIPATIQAEFVDRTVYVGAEIGYYRLELGGVVSFVGRLDEARLGRAVRLLLDAEPVLGCRFVADVVPPVFQRLDTLDTAQLLEVRDSEDPAADAAAFIAEPFDREVDPQVRAMLLHGPASGKRHNDRGGVPLRLADKVAVITGAGSGMGRAMANLFAAEGAKVLAADWHAGSLGEVVAEVRAAGGEITGVQGNVANQEDCEHLIEAAVATYGGLDILCNNAGVMDQFQGVAELDDEVWDRVMSINLDGPMYLTRKAVPIMIARGGGSIVNTASAAAMGGGAAGAAYTVSKHGLVGLTRSTSWRYALDGIRCNAMACGAVETNIQQSIDSSHIDAAGAARYQQYQALIPAFLKPLDIAELALFLASDEAKHINGAIVPIDGGWASA